jgi:hypothetical protein
VIYEDEGYNELNISRHIFNKYFVYLLFTNYILVFLLVDIRLRFDLAYEAKQWKKKIITINNTDDHKHSSTNVDCVYVRCQQDS